MRVVRPQFDQPNWSCRPSADIAPSDPTCTKRSLNRQLHELQRRHHKVRGAVAPLRLQLQLHLPRRVALHPLVGRRRAGDEAAELFWCVALVGVAAHRRMPEAPRGREIDPERRYCLAPSRAKPLPVGELPPWTASSDLGQQTDAARANRQALVSRRASAAETTGTSASNECRRSTARNAGSQTHH